MLIPTLQFSNSSSPNQECPIFFPSEGDFIVAIKIIIAPTKPDTATIPLIHTSWFLKVENDAMNKTQKYSIEIPMIFILRFLMKNLSFVFNDLRILCDCQPIARSMQLRINISFLVNGHIYMAKIVKTIMVIIADHRNIFSAL